MKNILIITSDYLIKPIKRYLKDYPQYTLFFDTRDAILKEGTHRFIERKIKEINSGKKTINGIIVTGDDNALLAAIIAKNTGLTFPSIKSVFETINKYLSRLIQKKCVPENIPPFFLSSEISEKNIENITFPLVVRPVRGSLSRYTHFVNTFEQLKSVVKNKDKHLTKINQLYNDILLWSQFNCPLNNTHNDLLCEAKVKGTQITLDGLIFNGQFYFFGITRGSLLSGTNSFIQWDYPYKFSQALEKKIIKVTKQYVSAVGLDNTVFNIEFLVDENENQIWLIELNPRISSQFIPLVEAVTGHNMLHIACQIACGHNPFPQLMEKKTNFSIASSCVLRLRKNMRVIRIPTEKEIEKIESEFPQAQIRNVVPHQNMLLSQMSQDSETYRYCLVNIAGDSLKEIKQIFEQVKQKLKYDFEEI